MSQIGYGGSDVVHIPGYVTNAITGITYDGSNRVATYIQDGITYTCSYYTSGNGNGKLASISGGGSTWTYTYNSSGLLTDETVS